MAGHSSASWPSSSGCTSASRRSTASTRWPGQPRRGVRRGGPVPVPHRARREPPDHPAVHAGPEPGPRPGAGLPRGRSYGSAGGPVHVYVTHLDYRGTRPCARCRSPTPDRSWPRTRQDLQMLLGDFNAEADRARAAPGCGRRLTDSWAVGPVRDRRARPDLSRRRPDQADRLRHRLARTSRSGTPRPRATPHSSAASDHRAVVATLSSTRDRSTPHDQPQPPAAHHRSRSRCPRPTPRRDRRPCSGSRGGSGGCAGRCARGIRELSVPSRHDRCRERGGQRLEVPRRSEGRDHHQPDRHPHQPAHHRRRDARGGHRRHRRRLRPGARLPWHGTGRQLGGHPHRPSHRADRLRRLRRQRGQDGDAAPDRRCGDRRLRHPGRRGAVLHLHLDDVHGDAGGGGDRLAVRRAGPTEPDRRNRSGTDDDDGLHLGRRREGDRPGARHDGG